MVIFLGIIIHIILERPKFELSNNIILRTEFGKRLSFFWNIVIDIVTDAGDSKQLVQARACPLIQLQVLVSSANLLEEEWQAAFGHDQKANQRQHQRTTDGPALVSAAKV